MGQRAVSILLVAAAACGGAGNKSAGPDKPLELVLVNYDSGSGVETTPAAGRFVELVDKLSGGSLHVRVEVGEFATDGRELTDVAAGHADLGWTGTRVFDVLGVREMRPLHAPFLIDNYELQAAVLDSGVPASMLAALRRLDVEPLALFADGLRFPAAAGSPLLTVEDWRGAGIWLLESQIQAEGVKALGGTPLSGGDPREMLWFGEARAIENMWIYYALGADYLYAPFVTPNMVLSPRTTALFANPETLARLEDRERRWITEAADEAAAWSAEHAADADERYIVEACDAGARVAFAAPEDLAALRAGVEPVYARLRADAATAENLAAIEALRNELPPPEPPRIPDSCRYEPADSDVIVPEPLLGPGPTGMFPAGTYRYELTAEDLPEVAEDRGLAAGVLTWEMGDGEWKITTAPHQPGLEPLECQGWYAVDGAVVTFAESPLPESIDHCMPPVWTVRWAAKDDTVIWGIPSVVALAPYFSLYPWELIG